MTLPPGTKIILYPETVEYRSRAGQGIRVVKVFKTTGEYRILAQTEVWRATLEVSPMSLTVPEVLFYVHDARSRLTGSQESNVDL